MTTATKQTNPLRFRLDDVRVDWPELFFGKQFNGTGDFRCGATLILGPDHPQFKQMQHAIETAAREKWKDKWESRLKGARLKDNVCLRDGDAKAKYDGYVGNFYVTASCKGNEVEELCAKPPVYDKFRNEINPADVRAGKARNPIYRGCYVNALIEVYAMDQYGDQVNAKLVGIQFRRDGDAFGSAPARADDFEDVTEGADADDFGGADAGII